MSRKTANQESNRASLSLESLEDRTVPTVVLGGNTLSWIPTISLNDGTVTIDGSRFSDSAKVTHSTNGTADLTDDTIVVKVSNQLGTYSQTFNLFDSYGNSIVSNIKFNGYQGNDTFLNWSGLTSTAYGHSGNDILQGGSNVDRMFGGSGNDIIAGGSGNDKLYGSYGDDIISGGAGRDTIYGQDGADRLYGNNDNDTIHGGSGADHIDGGSGNDYLRGGADADQMYGGWGDDTMNGDSGNDYLRGNAGNDYVRGGSGHDKVYGDAGNDSVLGESGNDRVYGGSGNDLVSGGDGDDRVYGDADADLVFGGDGSDHVYGGTGDDQIYGGAVHFNPNGSSTKADQDDWNYDYLYGGAGADFIDQEETWFDSVFGITAEDTVAQGSLDIPPPFPGFGFDESGEPAWSLYGHHYTGPVH